MRAVSAEALLERKSPTVAATTKQTESIRGVTRSISSDVGILAARRETAGPKGIPAVRAGGRAGGRMSGAWQLSRPVVRW